MSERFDRKRARIVTENGEVLSGTAEHLPAGCGPAPSAPRCEALMEALLEEPFWIADLLPMQVPREAPGQYFAVDRYFRQPRQQAALHRKQAELLLRLNCYADMEVCFDCCESWERNPEPEAFVRRMEALAGNEFLRAVFPDREAMIDIEPGDTWMTVYCRDPALLELIRRLTAAEGLFFWQPPER